MPVDFAFAEVTDPTIQVDMQATPFTVRSNSDFWNTNKFEANM